MAKNFGWHVLERLIIGFISRCAKLPWYLKQWFRTPKTTMRGELQLPALQAMPLLLHTSRCTGERNERLEPRVADYGRLEWSQAMRSTEKHVSVRRCSAGPHAKVTHHVSTARPVNNVWHWIVIVEEKARR